MTARFASTSATLMVFMTLMTLVSCSPKTTEQMVMAREVPERMDDFIWENDRICYRVYGKALEGETLSPGFDMWAKLPGALVADRRYKDDLENGKSYHKDWGDGKDCYKVGKSLGAGASVPLAGNEFQYPETNWRSSEILSLSPEKVVFVLHYPWWKGRDGNYSLDKKITVISGSCFCKVEDTWHWDGDSGAPMIVAGVARHEIESEMKSTDRLAIWEKASDQSAEPEDGMIGVAVIMPGAVSTGLSADASHSICGMPVTDGSTLTYWTGSCWSKGSIKTDREWFELVRKFNAEAWEKAARKK